MTDIVNAVLEVERYDFIRLSGELINLKFMEENNICTKFIYEEDGDEDECETILEARCKNSNIFYKKRLEIYFDAYEFNFRDSLEFVRDLHKNLLENDFSISKDDKDYGELECLLNFNHMLAEAVKIGTQNEMMQYFGYGNTQYNLFITNQEEKTKPLKRLDLIQLDKFYINNEYKIKLYADFTGGSKDFIHRDKLLDIFKISMSYSNYNFNTDMILEDLKDSITNKIANVSLQCLTRGLEGEGAFTNNKTFKGLNCFFFS